ncbi:MAG: hypothetical protein BHW65_08930 [Verrucomicrobia bacterium CAG:312_58_20]|nr:MAG: hypothetical protein BHW65_08930 [Verrucomicrobia bacterium CAG:312_58_20]
MVCGIDLAASPADGYIYIKIPKTIETSPPDRNFFLTGRGFFACARRARNAPDAKGLAPPLP